MPKKTKENPSPLIPEVLEKLAGGPVYRSNLLPDPEKDLSIWAQTGTALDQLVRAGSVVKIPNEGNTVYYLASQEAELIRQRRIIKRKRTKEAVDLIEFLDDGAKERSEKRRANERFF